MGKIFLLLFGCSLAFQYGSQAQDVRHQESVMSLGRQSSFYIEVDGANKKMIESSFKDFMKNYGKVNYNSKSKEFFLPGLSLPGISSRVDVYASLVEGKNQSTVFAWFDTGSGFVNPNDQPKETEAVKELMTNLYLFAKRRVIEEELKEEEKKLSNLEKELKKLQDKNKGFHNDIEKAKEAIAKAEKNIEENLKQQEIKHEEIKAKEKYIEKVTMRLNNLGKE